MRLVLVTVLLGCILTVAGCGANPENKTPAPVPPSAVSAATAIPVAAGSQLQVQAQDTVIILTWGPLAGAHGYFVYRDGSTQPLMTLPVSGTMYQDIGLTNGRTYTYTIAPVGADGKVGSPSAPVMVAPKSH